MAIRKRKYIPNKKLNPVVQANKLDSLKKDLEKHSSVLKTVINTYDKHVEHLANFASHDMKNALQSMDSILYVNKYDELTEESWDTLKTCLKNIRHSFENFSKLVPYSNSKKFQIERLFIALNLLIKQDVLDNKIELIVDYPKGNEVDLPFQNILQVLHNIIINSITSFKINKVDSPSIDLKCGITEGFCEIIISDNGKFIDTNLKEKIFEYGYTTTSGSGIGLYHAKYVCGELKGDIRLDFNEDDYFNKSFIIKLPLNIT